MNQLDVVEIHDPFGPTIHCDEFNAIVVSSETIPGQPTGGGRGEEPCYGTQGRSFYAFRGIVAPKVSDVEDGDEQELIVPNSAPCVLPGCLRCGQDQPDPCREGAEAPAGGGDEEDREQSAELDVHAGECAADAQAAELSDHGGGRGRLRGRQFVKQTGNRCDKDEPG